MSRVKFSEGWGNRGIVCFCGKLWTVWGNLGHLIGKLKNPDGTRVEGCKHYARILVC